MPQNPTDEDAQRMFAVASGDTLALRALIEKWQRPLISFLYRSCGSMEDAEELAQATFVRLYQAAPRYEAKAAFSTYLFHIARRLLLNHLRSRKRKPLEFVEPAELPERIENTRESQRIDEWEELFEQALATLPEQQRTALLLLKQQELTYDEIAESMNAKPASVKTWIHRAREGVKNFINRGDSPS